MAAQSRGALAADPRTARPAARHAGPGHERRGRLGEAGRADGLCRVLAARCRGQRSDRRVPGEPPRLVGRGSCPSDRDAAWYGLSARSGDAWHRRVFCRLSPGAMLASGPVPSPEFFMRLTSMAAAAALAVVSVTTSLSGQRPDAQIDARSMQLLEQGRAQKAAGNLDGATDTLETAVTVDPRNRGAFILLAEVADA